MAQTQDKFVVRLPDGMRDEIAAAAKANKRSMNAEIIARLSGRTTLLDQFAGQAMAAMLTGIFVQPEAEWKPDHVAFDAYLQAEVMMAERAKTVVAK